jgi:hypothetical protein
VRPAATEGADEVILRDFRTAELPLLPPKFEPLFELPPQPVHEKRAANASETINFRIWLLTSYFGQLNGMFADCFDCVNGSTVTKVTSKPVTSGKALNHRRLQ